MNSTNEQNRSEIQEKSGPLVVGILITAAAATGYAIWRVVQSKERAEAKTNDPNFFKNKAGSGQIGDAFRHIYVSMLLRRYITRVGSATVMGGYEFFHPNPHKRDTYMDKHNNKVGRHTQYWTFRGKYIRDRYKWELWAERARNWVKNTNNGVFMDWYETDPDKETAKSEEANVNNNKYLYYR